MINKWDLIEKDHKTADTFKKNIQLKLGNMSYIPVIFTSVMKKQRIFKAVEMAIKIQENRQRRIPTSKLNNFMLPIIEKSPPPSIKGKYIRIKYVTQLPAKTPAFAFFCNLPQYIKPAYKKFLENQIRSNFDFEGVPMSLFFKKK